jgi:hypothetical protein
MKFGDLVGFSNVIDDFGLVPEAWVAPVAVTLPAVEIFAAIGLLLDMRGALGVIVALLLLFIAVLFYGIWLGLDIDCGCFGPEDSEANAYGDLYRSLARDIALLTGAVYLYWWRVTHLAEKAGRRMLLRKKQN